MNEQEINALIYLLDDPDEQIYAQIHDKLLQYGQDIILPLEQAWGHSDDALVQQRIEDITHYINFSQVKADLVAWYRGGATDLLEGAIIINRYRYPTADAVRLKYDIEEMVREAWLGMRYEMTPVEQVKLLNHVFFTVFKYEGNLKDHHNALNSYLSKVVETKSGNQISLAILYSVMARSLNIPVYGVNLPQHFVLGYVQADTGEVLFYINPFNQGQIFTRQDVVAFLKQLKLPVHEQFYGPANNQDIIRRVIRNLIVAYEHTEDEEKVAELNELLQAVNAL